MGIQKNTIEHIKIFKDIDYGFNGFDAAFWKNLIELFNFIFNCRFYFIVVVAWNLLYNDSFQWPSMIKKDEPILWYLKIADDFRWLSWLKTVVFQKKTF